MVLHTVNQNSNLLDDCLTVAAPGDSLLLLQNGVYALQTRQDELQTASTSGIALYVLSDDLKARGLSSAGDDTIQSADYEDFVDLVVAADRVIAWH
ncbi:MAG: sulfurtransferase complex subunit TusB [Pseudomonadota bacterium]